MMNTSMIVLDDTYMFDDVCDCVEHYVVDDYGMAMFIWRRFDMVDGNMYIVGIVYAWWELSELCMLDVYDFLCSIQVEGVK